MVKDVLGVGRIVAELIKVLQKTGTGVAKPWQTRRVGKAQTDVQVERISRLANAKHEAAQLVSKKERFGALSVEDKALLERTITTKFNEFMREQQNRERIVERSLQLASDEKGKSRPVGEDWLLRFMKYASEVSDEKIQEIWAQIFVNEAIDNKPRATLKSIDSLRFFDTFFCELFRICCLCYECFGFIFSEFIDYHLNLNDAEYRRSMKILESFGVVNPYQLSAEVDLLQRYELLYFSKDEEVGVSRLSNIDSPVYLLSPIGVNLGEIVFSSKFYDERWSSKEILRYVARLDGMVPLKARSICLWGFIQNNLIAHYGDTISIGVDGVGGYFSIHSNMSEDDRVTFEIEFKDKRQVQRVKKFAPEFFLISKELKRDRTGKSIFS